jgi:hypothetical protein
MLTHPLAQKYRELCREAQALSSELERGQAATPLADHFAAMLHALDREPLCVALVPLSAADRAGALGWLLGEAYRTVWVQAGVQAGLTEVQTGAGGFVLDDGQGRRQSFAELGPLLAALQALGPQSEGLRLALPADTAAQGLTLLVAEQAAALAQTHGLASAVGTRAELLLLAAPAAAVLPESLGESLKPVLEAVGSWAPLLTETGIGPARWPLALQQGCGALLLQPLTVEASPPALFTDPNDDARALLLLLARARKLQLAVQTLAERHEQLLRQTQARRQREEAAARPALGPPVESPTRRSFERLRQRVQADVSALLRLPADSARRNRLPDGALRRAIDGHLIDLRASDLRQEPGPRTVMLSVSSGLLAHLQQALRGVLREELRADLANLSEGLDALKRDVESGIESLTQQPTVLTLPPVDERELWKRLSEALNVELRYRGELPRRSFWQRLGEGRRMVFGVMMVLSLVGTLGGLNWRGLWFIGFVFLALFVGAVFWTYRSWKQEDADKLDTELSRVREQLDQECERLAGEAQRAKEQQLAEHLDLCRKTLLLRLEELAQALQQREQEELTQQRERAAARARRADQLLRDLSSLQMRVGKIRQEAMNLESDAQRQFRDAARKQKLLP